LRPAVSPDGSLSLVTMSKTWLNVLVFGAVALGGVLLIRNPLSQRLFAVALVVIGLVLTGVFLPTLAVQLLDVALGLSILVVLIGWFAWYAVTTLPNKTATVPANPFSAPPAEGGRRLELTPVAPPATSRPPDAPASPPPEVSKASPDTSQTLGDYVGLKTDSPAKSEGPKEGGPSNG
jgi:hypothetical protein